MQGNSWSCSENGGEKKAALRNVIGLDVTAVYVLTGDTCVVFFFMEVKLKFA